MTKRQVRGVKPKRSISLALAIYYVCCFLVVIGGLVWGCFAALIAHDWQWAAIFGGACILATLIFMGDSDDARTKTT